MAACALPSTARRYRISDANLLIRCTIARPRVHFWHYVTKKKPKEGGLSRHNGTYDPGTAPLTALMISIQKDNKRSEAKQANSKPPKLKTIAQRSELIISIQKLYG